MAELHGIKTIEDTSGSVVVTTIPTAIIGLVGTAPDASPGTQAMATCGSVLLDSALTFTATEPGVAGNKLQVDTNSSPGAATTATWQPDSGLLTITLIEGDGGKITSTATDVINAVSDAMTGVQQGGMRVQLTRGGTGDGVISPFSLQLAGGTDEPFPLNTPVVVAGGITQGKKLGLAGTLYPALEDIFDQYGALVVVIRCDVGSSEAARRARVIAAINALPTCKPVTTYQPRILIAPEFSTDNSVGKALESMANKLKAVAYLDSSSMATAQDVVKRRDLYGERVELLRPRIQKVDATGALIYRPYSAAAAGLRARIDVENGWWWSKSNQVVYNITGTEQVDDWTLDDENCTANLLNMDNVSTLIRHDGFRHWGNRNCSTVVQYQFEAVRRTRDVIEESIQSNSMPYLDRPLDKWNIDDILRSVNSYLRSLVALRAIFGGIARPNPELNTADSLAAGKLYIDYDFGPKSPLEQLTFTTAINKTYGQTELNSYGTSQ